MGELGLTSELTFSLLVLLVLVPLGGALYQWVASAGDARRFPATGRLVDIGYCRLHVDLRGEGSPAVVFEAGIAATSSARHRAIDRAFSGKREPRTTRAAGRVKVCRGVGSGGWNLVAANRSRRGNWSRPLFRAGTKDKTHTAVSELWNAERASY